MRSSARTGLLILAAAAALLAPFVVYPILVMDVLCFALFACAFNLLMGFSGLLSFGHAAFFAAGAYAGGYAMKAWVLTPELGILFGGLCASALGYLIGNLGIRRQGIYFAMITLRWRR
jgi:branched-chain amino acid transport system permease protein